MARRVHVLQNHLRGDNTVAASQVLPSFVSAKYTKRPLKVAITGAAGNIAYTLAFMVAKGGLGRDQPIELRLLDLPMMGEKLKGVEMEIMDGAFPLITKIIPTTEYKIAFADVDVALLVGAKPRGPGMQRADLLRDNAQIFAGQGKALNQYASRDVKVVVVGNPANTNALIALTNAPDIPPANFTALTRLDQNRAVAQISAKVKCKVEQVKNVIIWGNHSKTQYPDVTHATIVDYPTPGTTSPAIIAVNDPNWLKNEYEPIVQDRGAAIINARKQSSIASAANAVIDHMHDWINGTPKGEYVSMAVHSDGSYGVPKGIVYSFPVVCANGRYKIVQGLKIDEYSKKKMIATAEELLSERKDALGK